MTQNDLKDLLDSEATRINSPAFIADDPVQFPRRFESLPDIEIAALLSAIIAWGNRKMICRDADRLLSLMDNRPLDYVLDRGYEDLPDGLNIHRTLFSQHLRHLLRGLREVYTRYGSLDAFAAAMGCGDSKAPAWLLVERLNALCADANGGISCTRTLPGNMKTTALKRVNMALRWLVRDDGIVDMGVWKSIPKSRLYIPLDVHVGNTARELGLLDRKAADRRSTEIITDALRKFRPDDPVFYDYALFGLGIEKTK
ncbi:MAG: TIGR02757 family protein [Muribaculaceae bacterium]|nr:TIGR02757 family protein [Muribaculaceae bacterium]